MKKSRFYESQILAIIVEKESGFSAAEICRNHWVSEAIFPNGLKKYTGMTVEEHRRLKELKQENARLKRMYCNLSLAHYAIMDLWAKKF